MYILFGTLSIVLAIAMILVVIVQNSKGGGLSSTFGGGATQMLGARRGDEFIEKLTWYLAVGILVCAFVANVSASSDQEIVQAPKIEDVINNPVLAPSAPLPEE